MSVILKVKKSLHPTIQYTCSSSWGKQMLHNLYCVRTFRGFLDTILNMYNKMQSWAIAKNCSRHTALLAQGRKPSPSAVARMTKYGHGDKLR